MVWAGKATSAKVQACDSPGKWYRWHAACPRPAHSSRSTRRQSSAVVSPGPMPDRSRRATLAGNLLITVRISKLKTGSSASASTVSRSTNNATDIVGLRNGPRGADSYRRHNAIGRNKVSSITPGAIAAPLQRRSQSLCQSSRIAKTSSSRVSARQSAVRRHKAQPAARCQRLIFLTERPVELTSIWDPKRAASGARGNSRDIPDAFQADTRKVCGTITGGKPQRGEGHSTSNARSLP